MTEERKQTIPRVLFVDDEENVLRSLRRLFVDEELEILTATSGKEGLAVLKENEVSVIVSDQRMPEMSGAEFLEKSIRVSPESVKIVLTGYADINAAMDAINKGGAYRYVTKPWNDTELIITVLNAVETYHLKKENRYLTALTKKQNEELKKWSAELEFYVQQHTVDLTKQNKELKKLNEKLKNNFHDFISAFYNLLELRNKVLYTHSNNVATLVSDMVQRMGLADEESETIIVAAQLHDIGKIGISDSILIKTAGELTAEEKAEYVKHPLIGQAAIDFVEDLRPAGILIRHHHEWYNGDGFPDRLKLENIPIGARIIAIADKFEQLAGDDLSGQKTEKALQKIKNLSGSQFDPDLYRFLSDAAHERTTVVVSEPVNIEVEMKPKDLLPGMFVSRDVRSGTGLLLLRKGTVLDTKNIETMKRGYHLDPAKSGIFVWSRRKETA